MRDVVVRRIGEGRGRPRLYLDMPCLSRSDFNPGCMYSLSVEPEAQRIVLTISSEGDRVVSSKSSGGSVTPVVDIHNTRILSMFDGLDQVRIILSPGNIVVTAAASALAKRETIARLRERIESGQGVSMAGVPHGGGVMCAAAHEGLGEAGLPVTMSMACEIDDVMLAQSQKVNPVWGKDTLGLSMGMQELVQDKTLMSQLPEVTVVVAGVPCSGASRAGRTKRKLEVAEQHPEVGYLVAPLIMLVQQLRPAVVVVENPVPYATTGSAWILRGMLGAMGYEINEVQLGGAEFGVLENRQRWFLCASVVPISLEDLAPANPRRIKFGDIMEEVPDSDPTWGDKAYLFEKAERDAAQGKGFKMALVTPESDSVPTLRKGMSRCGSTDPLVVHPTKNLYRCMTPGEHAAAKGVDPVLIAGMPKTAAHELLGQSVLHAPVKALFRRIGDCLIKAVSGAAEKASSAKAMLSIARGVEAL